MSILKELEDNRVASFYPIVTGCFLITEMCDEYFYLTLSKAELLQLADELIELANK